jgi:hypothetical protein
MIVTLNGTGVKMGSTPAPLTPLQSMARLPHGPASVAPRVTFHTASFSARLAVPGGLPLQA